MSVEILPFFHNATGTFSYLVVDRESREAAIVDPVLDYDPRASMVSTLFADALLAHVHDRKLDVRYILETHAHADHLSAGGYLRDELGAALAIGAGIVGVQRRFAKLLDLGTGFVPDGSAFDRLLKDGDTLALGSATIEVLATPGHTEDGVSYLLQPPGPGNGAHREPARVIVGDTLFAPDVGTARCDFPGGDAETLFRSIERLLALPEDTVIHLCHDYPPKGREPLATTTVGAERARNPHLGGRGVAEFVSLRTERDATLPAPQLLWPSIQVNIRGGRLPPAGPNGIAYLKIPLQR